MGTGRLGAGGGDPAGGRRTVLTSLRTRLRAVGLRAAGRGRPDSLGDLHLPPGARVLLIRPDHLGDVLFAGPALARLARSRPDLDVTLAVGPWSAGVARLVGRARVMALPFPWFDRGPKPAPWVPYLRLRRVARTLRGDGYAAAFVLRDDDAWSAWLARAARIPTVVGHSHPEVRGFLSHELAGSPIHTAAKNVALVAAAVGDRHPPDPESDPLLLQLPDTRTSPLPPGNWLAVHPGSGAAVKRWTLAAWSEFASLVPADVGFVVTGGPGEEELTARVAGVLNDGAPAGRPAALNLGGTTSLPELAAVFGSCRVAVGPDSGPMHLAVAAGTPTVHLFGPASAERFGPWGDPARHRVLSSGLPCAPCGRLDWPDPADHPCVRLIEPRAAARAALEVAGNPVPII